MRVAISVLLVAVMLGAVQAQVIKGESTDDAAYAPRPAARWHSPESQGAVPDDQRGGRRARPGRQGRAAARLRRSLESGTAGVLDAGGERTGLHVALSPQAPGDDQGLRDPSGLRRGGGSEAA